MLEVTIKETSYKEYGKCIEISNGIVDLLVTVDIGPRVIRYGFTGKENEFCENPGASTDLGRGEAWKIRGGHRLWHSPESMPRSYMPDNEPVEWSSIENGIKVSQKVEPWTQIKKDMEITLEPSGKVKVVHKITNKNAWSVELSAWALTVMAPGGKQIVPQPHRETGLLGNRLVALWPYAKMNDHRIYWGDKYITFTQDPNTSHPFKFGIPNEDSWAAYLNHGNMFIKRYTHQLGAAYPDFGVSYETYTTDFMMEMESLSPITRLEPDASVIHTEVWELISGVERVSNDENEMDSMVKKYIG